MTSPAEALLREAPDDEYMERMERLQRLAGEMEVAARRRLLRFAAIMCCCRMYYDREDNMPPQAGCPVHGAMMIPADGPGEVL
jgi:hypothetical protein